MGFSGTIDEGYGKGKVESEFKDKVEVLKSIPKDKIYFNIYKGRDSERYLLKKTGDKNWLLINYTPTEKSDTYKDVPLYKPKYDSKKPEDLDPSNPNEVWAPKLDGAHNTLVLRGGKAPDLFSYRSSTRSDKKIDHTYRLKDIYRDYTPKELKKTILRGEVFLPGQKGSETGRLLNSNVWKSRRLQQQNQPLDLKTFDVVKYKGDLMEDEPYGKKLDILKEISEKIPSVNLPPLAESTEEKKQLMTQMLSGDHPLSTEGLVVYNRNKPRPTKVKATEDWDMKITGTFPAQPGTKYEDSHIGGFEGIIQNPKGIPNRKIKVGTGLDDELRKDAYENPEDYIGEWAKIKSQHIHDSGLHQAPVLLEIRSEKYPNKQLEKTSMKVSDKLKDSAAQGAIWGGSGLTAGLLSSKLVGSKKVLPVSLVQGGAAGLAGVLSTLYSNNKKKTSMTKKAQKASREMIEKIALSPKYIRDVVYNAGKRINDPRLIAKGTNPSKNDYARKAMAVVDKYTGGATTKNRMYFTNFTDGALVSRQRNKDLKRGFDNVISKRNTKGLAINRPSGDISERDILDKIKDLNN